MPIIKTNCSIIIRRKFGIYYKKHAKHANRFCGKIKNFLISLNMTHATPTALFFNRLNKMVVKIKWYDYY